MSSPLRVHRAGGEAAAGARLLATEAKVGDFARFYGRATTRHTWGAQVSAATAVNLQHGAMPTTETGTTAGLWLVNRSSKPTY